MKLKDLESMLQRVNGFEKPKVVFEQYTTSPHLASHLLNSVDSTFDDIAGSAVAELGVGPGKYL